MKDDQNLDFTTLYRTLRHISPYQKIGKIYASKGMAYEVNLPNANIGCEVEIHTDVGDVTFGEVIGIKGKTCIVMPYEDIEGVNADTHVYLRELGIHINLSDDMIGRVVDFRCNPLDEGEPLQGPFVKKSIYGSVVNPLQRPPIREALDTGVNSINSFITAGKGQRLAIMAGSGVGKSVLMGMMARNTKADINVIALIGERGREVLEFIKSDLGEEGLKRSVIVVATSDCSALVRAKAAYTAMTVAEYFRDKGKDVLLMMDSVTRFAMAQREIGVSLGEPPGQKGYTPSVFSKLPKLLERAGTLSNGGSITAICTVLVEGGDMDEPITDAVRAIADGHIVLTRELASKGHYPAIDVLQSVSRVMIKVVSREHRVVANYLRDLLAAYKDAEDLINVGAYVKGSNLKVDKAISVYNDIINLLKQEIAEPSTLEEVYDRMVEIARMAEKVSDPSLEVKDEGPSLPNNYNVF